MWGLSLSILLHLAVWALLRPSPVPVYEQAPVEVVMANRNGAAIPARRKVARAVASSPVARRVGIPAPAPPAGNDIVGENSVDSPAHLETEPHLSYPPLAERQGIEGQVTLLLVVDENGHVTSAEISRGAGHGFDEAALAAAKDFRFSPARKDGRAVAVRFRWIVRFRLEG